MYTTRMSTRGTPFGLGATQKEKKAAKKAAKAAQADAAAAAGSAPGVVSVKDIATKPAIAMGARPGMAGLLQSWGSRIAIGALVAGGIYLVMRMRKKRKG